MKRTIFIAICLIALCGCSGSESKGEVDIDEGIFENHSYLFFSDANRTIGVLHNPECEYCKNNPNY